MRHGNISVFVPHAGCPNQCSFCNQKTITGHIRVPSSAAVCAAVDTALAGSYSWNAEMEIAFFGGSFTAIPPGEMIHLLETVQPYLTAGRVHGIRISTRPDYIDSQVLALLKDYGVTAIELGAQSMDDQVLVLNQRGHTAQDVRNAAQQIHKFGFSLGLQMMTGLYGSTPSLDTDTARQLIALRPDTVRIYPTAVLKGTLLGDYMAAGVYYPPDTQAAVRLCATLLPMFEDAGISVIRLGLHSSMDIEQNLLGGAYHPAFRELVENQIYLDKALTLLSGLPKGPVTVYVPAGCTSKMIGQKRGNLLLLSRQGYQARVKEDSSLSIQDRGLRIVTATQGKMAERNG